MDRPSVSGVDLRLLGEGKIERGRVREREREKGKRRKGRKEDEERKWRRERGKKKMVPWLCMRRSIEG